MYVDPPAPKPKGPHETPPINTTGPLEDPQRAWRFNPDYERLVVAWQTVKPQLDELRTVLDKAYQLATSPQTWDAPVGKRYVEDIREWRNRLALYRHAVLTTISDEAADTPRWLPTTANAPHAYPS
ncbi:hypothetical protein ACFMQL_21490 [Nonomuraea fastidiosa]|jgi:hypothetical protein|uniref:hypothetical protein n=1 Tax=Nonomuraea TaxID=83681 RepID=UPI003252AA33